MAAAHDKQIPSKLMVAAIDFGTTYTGFGYSMRDTYKSEPLRIWTKHWGSSGGGPALVSEKTPTVLLLNPDKTFHSFGYDAEDKYSDLAQEDEHIGWYYFKHFKMTLYHEKINRTISLRTDQGLELPALEVFKHSISYIKGLVLDELRNRGVLETAVMEKELGWVLTVPAIWDFTAKQFMREAAKLAGIPTEQLTLALEPEAASVFIKHMNVNVQRAQDEGPTLSPYDPGTRYMVLDLGGGTVDVTVREVMPDRTLKEVTKASGGAWGGLYVNEEIYKFLEKIFTPKILGEFKAESTSDYLDLERSIEMVKRKLGTDGHGRFTLGIPMDLRDRYTKAMKKTASEANISLFANTNTEMKKDKLKFPKEVMGNFFSACIQSITEHCRTVLELAGANMVQDIIMVGGFAESTIMQLCVKKAFPTKNIVIPPEAGLVVLKGAVLYGHHPRIVSCRVASKTIGLRNLRYFMKETDPEEKKMMEGGVPYCKDIFHILCEAGSEFMLGETVTHDVFPLRPNMTEMTLNLYQTNERNPTYTTDKGCEEIGKIRVEMPDTSKGMDRQVIVSLTFGDTELIVEGKDNETGRSADVHLDLLKH
ncbi:heat shock 70 kDa protein 12A-like [Mytilus edulis]|uniref:heat shock 70 kDa protein 12A-like n=1 Tax=Mytilus edulis TaxID=6550 RepID=UPI0039F1282E